MHSGKRSSSVFFASRYVGQVRASGLPSVRYTDVYPHFISVPLCARLPWYTCTTLSGVECQNSSGAKHRSCSGTKLNAGSRLHYPHRSRGLHPGSKLLRRLLRLILRISIRAFTDTQRGGNLPGLWRLQKVLKVAVFREDIVEGFVHDIVGGCVDESGVLIDLLGGGFSPAESRR